MKSFINNKLQKLKKLKTKMITEFETGEYEKVKVSLKEYKVMLPDDIDIYSIEANLSLVEQNFEKAIEITKYGLKNKPFNYDLTYNLACLYNSALEHGEAVLMASNAFKYANTDKEQEQANELMDKIIAEMKENGTFDEIMNNIKDDSGIVDPRHFPLITTSKTCIGKNLFSKKSKGYYSNYYKMPKSNYPVLMFRHMKTETLKGELISNTKQLEISSKAVIPISVKEWCQVIRITVNQKAYHLQTLTANQFYYLPINEPGKVLIESRNEFIVGDVILLDDQVKKNEKKLVLNIFIDGLAEEVIKGDKLKKHMPNTCNFFKEGIRFINAYTNAEWTLPSVPTFFTGKYTINHNLFHPTLNFDIGRDYPLISNLFHDEGYYTFQINGDWRQTPTYGYARGFDRTVFSNFDEGFSCEEIILETIEQLKTFSNKKQFGWIAFPELHDVSTYINPSIGSQIKNSLYSLTSMIDNSTSVRKSHNDRFIEKYITELERLDYYLNIIYKYIEANYSSDEILISLVSDHGQSFLSDNPHVLGEKRLKVPMLITGGGIEKNIANELIENVDIFKIVTKACNIDTTHLNVDSRLPKILGGAKEREYTYSESIHPPQTYKAVITDKIHRLSFETITEVANDGRFDIEGYQISLINTKNNKDEQDIYVDKVNKYLKVIFEHIKGNIII